MAKITSEEMEHQLAQNTKTAMSPNGEFGMEGVIELTDDELDKATGGIEYQYKSNIK